VTGLEYLFVLSIGQQATRHGKPDAVHGLRYYNYCPLEVIRDSEASYTSNEVRSLRSESLATANALDVVMLSNVCRPPIDFYLHFIMTNWPCKSHYVGLNHRHREYNADGTAFDDYNHWRSR
jgi:hypothetical protein